ncbi:tetratricopeptide repeat protein [Candidatus Sodalis endolongispinus]|uniref:Tetratricopeptide repeat protein n=1 Tax=Candidatus Sodalis endolongispinus TaxID=2812662 RepID=A0ABS5YAP0_9GAMM|nr:tetratricopeptide repeat protein [Candidatus Sodalis endolongispinus]MBT9432076.1 tetratricopeptide repeat protein [Candidatus Sodalis endolongispinus]
MKRKWQAGVMALVLHTATALAAASDEQIAADCGKIDEFARLGESAFSQSDMHQAVEHYTAQAAWGEFCHLPPAALAGAYHHIALALLQAGEPLKARAWLLRMPEGDARREALEEIAPIVDRLQPALAASPMGTYWRYAGKGVWSTLSVMPEGESWRIRFSGYYMPLMGLYYGPNMGQFSTVTAIDHQQANWAS